MRMSEAKNFLARPAPLCRPWLSGRPLAWINSDRDWRRLVPVLRAKVAEFALLSVLELTIMHVIESRIDRACADSPAAMCTFLLIRDSALVTQSLGEEAHSFRVICACLHFLPSFFLPFFQLAHVQARHTRFRTCLSRLICDWSPTRGSTTFAERPSIRK